MENFYLNKKAVVVFDDGDKISRRNGTIISSDKDFIYLKIDTAKTEAIRISLIIRIELQEESR